MAKYGDGYRYKSGTLWGQAGGGGVVSDPYSGEVVWIVNIDWFGTGGVNEADYTRDINMIRGRQHYVNPGGSGFEKMRSGRVTITMDNINGRFDPYNADSPLYGYLLPGRKIQISVYDVATKATHIRFTGHVTDIQPSSGINEVTITAEDGMRWLTDAEYSTGVTYAKTVSEAIDLVLSFVAWPYARNIQPSLQPLQVFEPGTGSAITVIQELAEANLGAFFVDRFGNAVFNPVSYDVTTSHTIDQSQLLREIRFQQPWESVRNKIRVVANRKGKRPASIVWNMPGVERFEIGQTKVFGASFKNSDNITVENIIANSQIDGNGSDYSNYFTIAKSAVTSTECTLTATNNSGAVAYLISLRLVGNALVSSPENMTASDATSISTFGPRSFVLDNQMLQDRSFAAAYATMLKDHLKDPHKDPIIQIQQRPSLQYPIDLYDKVVLTSSKLGIDATYTVGGIEERWQAETGQDVITTLYLQTVLYDNTVITPDPFIPGALPEMPIPDMPPWYEPYIPPLPEIVLPDTTVTCLSGQYPTGPFYLTPTQTTLTSAPPVLEAVMNYPCTIRPAGVLYPSQLRLNIRTYEQIAGVWTPYVPNDIIKVTAFNSSNVDVATAVITGGGTAQTDRFATFYPASSLDVKGFKLKLDYSGVNGVPASDVTTTPEGLTVVHFGFDGPAATPLVNVGAWDTRYGTGGNDWSGIAPIPTTYAYWSEGRLNLKYPDGLSGYRMWRWTQQAGVCTAHTGATMTGISYHNNNNSSQLMIIYSDANNLEDDSTNFPDGVEEARTATVAAGNNGRTVEQFMWMNQPFGTNTLNYLADVVLTGFTWARTEKKITIGSISVANVCGSGLVY
jgi:hypothetical protein